MSVARPELIGTVAINVVPSKNETVPVGVPTAGGTGLTVAVKVMKFADRIVDADAVRLVVVAGVLLLLTTVWVTVGDVLAVNAALPL